MTSFPILVVAAIAGLCTGLRSAEFAQMVEEAREGVPRGDVTAERDEAGWRVTRLVLFGEEFGNANLEGVARLKSLQALEVRGEVGVIDGVWRKLRALRELRHLVLASNVYDGALLAIAGCPKLESLDLRQCKRLTDAGLEILKRFEGLRRLVLPDGIPSDGSVGEVKDLANLFELDLSRSYKVTDDGLSGLARLGALRSLGAYSFGPRAQAILEGLPSLEVLKITYCKTKQLNLSVLGGLRYLDLGLGWVSVKLPVGLRVLKIVGWTTEDAKAGRFRIEEPLPRCIERVHVMVPSGPLQLPPRAPVDLAWLSKLPALQEVVLQDPTNDAIASVTGLGRLRALTLTLSSCGKLPTDEGLRHLTGLRGLETLAVEDAALITDAGVAVIGELKGLRRLELGNPERVTAAGLACLWRLPLLEVLNISVSAESADAPLEKVLAGIALVKGMREVTLKGSVTDEALKALAQLRGLRRLDVGSCHGYTDGGLAVLVNALPELKTVVWSYTPGAAKAPVEANKKGKSTNK